MEVEVEESSPWRISRDWLLISFPHDGAREQRKDHPNNDEAPPAVLHAHPGRYRPQPEQAHQQVAFVMSLLPLEQHELGDNQSNDENQQHLGVHLVVAFVLLVHLLVEKARLLVLRHLVQSLRWESKWITN